jgi:hypothetical protein
VGLPTGHRDAPCGVERAADHHLPVPRPEVDPRQVEVPHPGVSTLQGQVQEQPLGHHPRAVLQQGRVYTRAGLSMLRPLKVS